MHLHVCNLHQCNLGALQIWNRELSQLQNLVWLNYTLSEYLVIVNRLIWNSVSIGKLKQKQIIKTHPATLLLAELSAICELAIHLVSPTTVLACGRRPTSLTVIIRCRDDFRTLTASSCGIPRKLRPFTSKIWSPTCGEGRAYRGVAEGTEQGGKDGTVWDCNMHGRSKVREVT